MTYDIEQGHMLIYKVKLLSFENNYKYKHFKVIYFVSIIYKKTGELNLYVAKCGVSCVRTFETDWKSLSNTQRDDLTGMQLSGNKVRKLEFLMADAVAQSADCIITIGGIQSNHCRATAVAAKYLNLDCYLILHVSKVHILAFPSSMCL